MATRIERVKIHSQRPLLAELERAVTWGYQNAKITPLTTASGIEMVTVIVTTQGKQRRCMGLFTARAWSSREGDEIISEIQVSAEYLNYEPVEIISTVLHEATHLLCFNQGIKDTSSGGVYHNKRFKEQAERIGLGCPDMVEGPTGFGLTHTPAQLRRDITDKFKPKFDVFDKFRPALKRTPTASKTVPFTCDCGTIRIPTGRVERGVDIACRVCGQDLMEKVV